MCLYSQFKDGGLFLHFLDFIFLEPWAALNEVQNSLNFYSLTPNLPAARSCFPGSGHQSSDLCLPLVITTAALVLLTPPSSSTLCPLFCRSFLLSPYLKSLSWPGLRHCGAAEISWWLERWGAHCWEGEICIRRMGYVYLGSGVGRWGWVTPLLDRVIKPFLDR